MNSPDPIDALLVVAKHRQKLPSAGASDKAQAQVERAKEKGRIAKERSRKATTTLEHHTTKKAAATKKHQKAVGDLKMIDDKISSHQGKHVDLTPKFTKAAAVKMGIVDEVATGSFNTTELKNDKTTLSPNSESALPFQATKMTKNQIATRASTAARRGTEGEWTGVVYGSKGFKLCPQTNKRVCIASSEMCAAKWKVQENKPIHGEESNWDKVLPQVAFSSDEDNIGMELLDEHGKKVTEELYQQNNESAKTVWIPNPDKMGELFDLLNKTGDDGEKRWKLGKSSKHQKMYALLTTKQGVAMCFKGERVYEGKVIVCGSRDGRLKTAGYRLTIHDESNVQFFAAYDDLTLNAAASKN